MEVYEIVAWGLFALIFAFLGMVLGATWKQMENEAKAAGVIRSRGGGTSGRGRIRGARRARARASEAPPPPRRQG
jgi:hypothetical protein